MDLLNILNGTIVDAGVRLIAPVSPYGLLSYVGAFAMLVLMVIVKRRRLPGWRPFWKAAFPTRIFGHVSTSADIRLYIFNTLLLSSLYGVAIVGMDFWAGVAKAALTGGFGAHAPLSAPPWLVLTITTIVEIAMLDFGYWGGHYLMHRVPALWAFHKVHHSAEVMTPLTEWRQHPVEMILMPNAISLASGVTYGCLAFLFGDAEPLALWRTNILLAIFFLTISHLRHSHVWLPFTGLLGRLLHSPAHHQIHHSTDPKHFDKNLGFALSIWDWLFGTLWIPREGERVVFGIGAESDRFHSVSGSLLSPFLSAHPEPPGSTDSVGSLPGQ